MESMHRFALLLLAIAASSSVRAQDLPDGKGKDLVQRICVDCHGLDVIVSQRATKEGWASIVDGMVVRGASGTKEEMDAIVEYLAKNFPKEPAKIRVGQTTRPASVSRHRVPGPRPTV